MRQQIEQRVRETIARELSHPCNRSKLYELIGVPDFVTPFPPTANNVHRTDGDVRQIVDEELAAIVKLVQERGGQR